MMHAQYLEWAGLPAELAPAVEDWSVHPLRARDGSLLAIGLMQGTEIHFAANPAVRGSFITRRRAAEYLGPLLEDKGFLTTRVHASTPEAEGFVKRMGFAETNRSRHATHFMLSAVPFQRAAQEF